MSENKVNFGLKNVHYAPITLTVQGEVQYGKPVRIPGAVELSLEPRGDMSEFYADDILYYSAGANQGYDGTLTIANIPEQFAIDCLGEEKVATHNLITEKVTGKGKNFALMFEFDGDIRNTKHVLFNCSANRPTVGSSTKTSTTEPFTNELTFIAMAREGDLTVKTKTTETTPQGVLDTWYIRVYDGIINKATPETGTFNKTNKQDLTFTIGTTGSAKVTGVRANGLSIRLTNDYTYDDAQNTVTIKQTYLDTLPNTTQDSLHNITIETDKGNYVSITLTVTG